jgi:aryl-alcohol dehydrogenase-like predicted oxidoreductase
MKLRSLGRSGLLVSEVGLGTNNFATRLDEAQAAKVVHKALDVGITLFDTADSYGHGRSEALLAAGLGSRRKDVVIATKWGNFRHPGVPEDPSVQNRGGGRAYIMKAVEDSLRHLKTDYIDLYQFHRPDDKTPIAETIRVLDDLIRQGKVRYVGVSNMPAWQIVEAQLTAREMGANPFVSHQDSYNIIDRAVERDLLPATVPYGLGLLPFSPLANGLLTGKYKRDAPLPEGTRLNTSAMMRERTVNDANFDVVEALTAFAQARDHTLLELAMSWLVAQPHVGGIIAGATRPEQIEQNAAAVGWALTADDMTEIDRLTQGR